MWCNSVVKVRITIDRVKCNLCNLCVRLCPTNVFKIKDGFIVIEEDICIICYGCIRLCPVGAISIDVTGYDVVDYVRY